MKPLTDQANEARSHATGRMRPLLNPQQHATVLWALHPDNQSETKTAAAFIVMRQKKHTLCDAGPIARKAHRYRKPWCGGRNMPDQLHPHMHRLRRRRPGCSPGSSAATTLTVGWSAANTATARASLPRVIAAGLPHRGLRDDPLAGQPARSSITVPAAPSRPARCADAGRCVGGRAMNGGLPMTMNEDAIAAHIGTIETLTDW